MERYTGAMVDAQDADEVLTVEDVAARLKVHPETVRRWLRAGTLRGFRLGSGTGASAWRIRSRKALPG
jgi:excisionase family DNA binding protein